MRAIVKHAFYSCQRQAARIRMHWLHDRHALARFPIFSLHTIAAAAINMNGDNAINMERLNYVHDLIMQAQDVVEHLYVPDLFASIPPSILDRGGEDQAQLTQRPAGFCRPGVEV